MKTVSFIGSDKNAGKTTSFNYIVDQMISESKGSSPLLLTSIGLNGETSDNYEGHGKPTIRIPKSHYFITSGEHLQDFYGHYQTIAVLSPPHFKKTFILGKALVNIELILEGPNEKAEIIAMKKKVEKHFPNMTILIDGSIDRQCIASPEVSDSFYFALLLSTRAEQLRKASDLLEPLYFEAVDEDHRKTIEEIVTPSCKSLLIAPKTEDILHQSTQIPFLDDQLKMKLEDNASQETLLYLGGALTPSLYALLSPYRKLTIVLDNFTLYHNITVKSSFDKRVFLPKLHLFHPMKVEKIFIKDEGGKVGYDLSKLPIINLFRQERV